MTTTGCVCLVVVQLVLLLASANAQAHPQSQANSTSSAAGATATVSISTSKALANVSPYFVSFNIDAADVWSAFAWNSSRLAALTSHLTPAKLRVGGGAQRDIEYNSTFLTTRWHDIVGLATAAGVELVWGTNPDLAQAKALVQYTAGYWPGSSPVTDWEFGNEPSPKSSDPSALAADFVSFSSALKQAWPSSPPRLVGPDTGFGAWADPPSPGSQTLAWLETFFSRAGRVLDAATVHIYPFDHTDVGGGSNMLDSICSEEKGVHHWCNYTRVMWPGPGELPDVRPVQDFALPFAAVARKANVTDVRIGETAATNHAGWPNVTNAFVSSFFSVYEMGWLAASGFSVMHRQVLACEGLISGRKCSYGLLSPSPTFKPAPDYWLSVLHKRTMGTTVLNVSASVTVPVTSGAGPTPPLPTPPGLNTTVRVYAHCTFNAQTPGSVTMMFANPQTFDIGVAVNGLADVVPRSEYVLTAPVDDPAGLQSLDVALNGVTLKASDDGLPPLTPVTVTDPGTPLILPALSLGFVVFPAANAKACL